MTSRAANGPPSPLLSHRLEPVVRAVRRALWRHVGRFLTATQPRHGRGHRRADTAETPRRALRLVKPSAG